ncbi:gp18 domain protein [Mycobacterium xenopi 3993]|nr:gp18 domain protein [Mycobacterium xenopi 3993]
MQAVVGVFIPGDRGAAFEQLRQWAQGVPILSDIVEAITGVVNGDLSDLSEWARKIPILSDLVELITGQEDGDENDLGTFFLNIRKFLANVNFLDPNFNLLAAANQFLSSILSPAGALTSLTDLPAHLFGNLAPARATMWRRRSTPTPSTAWGCGRGTPHRALSRR